MPSYKTIKILLIVNALLCLSHYSLAQDEPDADVINDDDEFYGLRIFEPSYFLQFDPVTAFDLVDKTPGFNSQEQSGGRGLDGVRSNMLINGKRPPPKGQSIWQQLSTKPYTSVSHIELIDAGAANNIDMQGYNQVVNVILKDDSANYYELSPEFGRTGTGDVSQRNERDFELNAIASFTLDVHEFNVRTGSFERTTRSPSDFVDIDPANPEQRVASQNQADREEQYLEAGSIFNLHNDSTLSVNAELYKEDRSSAPVSLSESSLTTAAVSQTSLNTGDWREVSAEYRRPIGERSELMFALLDSRNIDSSESSFTIEDSLLSSVRDRESGESAARLRLEHKLSENLTLRSTFSSAFNYFEGAYQLYENGKLQALDGSDSRVEEDRHSLTLGADWNLSPKWLLNASVSGGAYAITSNSLAEEVSSNKQSEVKGRVSASYQLKPRTTVKFESLFEIGQLSLSQFLASSSLSSEILTAGAVSLDSEQNWEHAISYDQRFGDRGVLKFKLGYLDLMNPIRTVALSDALTVSQNTFAEKRTWFNASIDYPFERFDMEDLMLSAGFTVSDSETIDPVTLESREVAWVRPLEWSLGMRKNPGDGQWTWGFNLWKNFNNSDYYVREIRDQHRSHEWRAFVEWEVISGLKLKARLESQRNDFNRSLLFSSVRQVGLDPAYISSSSSRRDSSTSFSIEWRRKKYLEISANINLRPRFRSVETLSVFGESSGSSLAREIAESPSAEIQFRIYNQ